MRTFVASILVLTSTVLVMVLVSWAGIELLIDPNKTWLGGEDADGKVMELIKVKEKPKVLKEKIEGFYLQEFGDNLKTSRVIEAKQYLRYEGDPALLTELVITTYNENGTEAMVIESKRAIYLENGDIKLLGSDGNQTDKMTVEVKPEEEVNNK
jgi:hypothetical protein